MKWLGLGTVLATLFVATPSPVHAQDRGSEAQAADRIAYLELALVELSRTDGSPRNVASTELLASRVGLS